LKTQQLKELYNSNIFKLLCSSARSVSGWFLDPGHFSPFLVGFGWFWSSCALSALIRQTFAAWCHKNIRKAFCGFAFVAPSNGNGGAPPQLRGQAEAALLGAAVAV
jgi:hypothetical protein